LPEDLDLVDMSSFFHNLRTLPRPFWILAGATFVNRFGLFVWPFLTIIITRNGNTAAQAGYAVGAYSVGSFIAGALPPCRHATRG
jgi:hypothetical protein